MSATSTELLRAAVTAFGVTDDAVTRDEFGEPGGPATVTVSADDWLRVVTAARDELGCRYFDWLSAVDYLDRGFAVLAHLVRLRRGPDQLLVRTWLPRENPVLASVLSVYAGAGWHERETHEMFGIEFTDHPDQSALLLPEEFEGHPLRKDFVLASRVAKAWPGAKEPGESEEAATKAPSRRRVAPPGVPSPDEWGPRPPGPASGSPATTERDGAGDEHSPGESDG